MSSSLLVVALWLTAFILPLVGARWVATRLSSERSVLLMVPFVGVVMGAAYNAMYQVSMLVLESARALSISEGSVSQLPTVSRLGAVAALLFVWLFSRGPRPVLSTPALWIIPMSAGGAGLLVFVFAPSLWVLWLSGFLAAGAFAAVTALQALVLRTLRAKFSAKEARVAQGRIDLWCVVSMAVVLLLTGIGADAHFDNMRVVSLRVGLLPIILGAWILAAGLTVLPGLLSRLKTVVEPRKRRPDEAEASGGLKTDDRRRFVRAIVLSCLQIMAFSPLDGPLTIVLSNHGLGSTWAGAAMLSMLLSAPLTTHWAHYVHDHTVSSEKLTTCIVAAGVGFWALGAFLAPTFGAWTWVVGISLGYPLMEMGSTLSWFAGQHVALRGAARVADAALLAAIRLAAGGAVLIVGGRLLAGNEWWLIGYCALFAVAGIVLAFSRFGRGPGQRRIRVATTG